LSFCSSLLPKEMLWDIVCTLRSASCNPGPSQWSWLSVCLKTFSAIDISRNAACCSSLICSPFPRSTFQIAPSPERSRTLRSFCSLRTSPQVIPLQSFAHIPRNLIWSTPAVAVQYSPPPLKERPCPFFPVDFLPFVYSTHELPSASCCFSRRPQSPPSGHPPPVTYPDSLM